MKAEFYRSNRQNLAAKLPDNALALFFSGFAPRKRADEDYPFFADRNFVYLTGIARDAGLILAIRKENGTYSEKLFLLPPDLLKERWTGRRTKADEASALSGIADISYTADFEPYFAESLDGIQSNILAPLLKSDESKIINLSDAGTVILPYFFKSISL